MRSRRSLPLLLLPFVLAPLAGVSCSDDDEADTADAGPSGDAGPSTEGGPSGTGGSAGEAGTPDAGTEPGALVHITYTGTVGVLLDEIPAGIRERVATSILAKPDEYWVAKAKRQLALSSYRLNFRP